MLATIFEIWFGVGAVLAVVTYGLTYGYFKGEFPWASNRGIAAGFALLTVAVPPMVIVPLVLSEGFKHGLRFR